MTNRKSQIIDVVNRYGTISIHELQEIFTDVSAMTIRRDIESLEKDGKLIRIHGGAKSLNSIIRSDELYEIREVTNLSKKRIIAQKAGLAVFRTER